MVTIDEKRWVFLIATKFFEERFGDEMKNGMNDERLKACLARTLSFRVVWGGPGKWSGRCDPEKMRIYAGPTPLEEFKKPVLEGDEILKMAREEYEIPDPLNPQMRLF